MAEHETAALCGDCGEPVTGSTVGEHMDQHGRLLPDDWNLASWPDGTAVLLDFPWGNAHVL